MKIATWNVERLKHHKSLDIILRQIEDISADILVLTETDSRLRPGYPYVYSTPTLQEIRPGFYRATENRVTVCSRYPCVRQHSTYDKYTSICLELDTTRGSLLVYGTIIGIYGNREESFLPDLKNQMQDIRRLTAAGIPVCIVGDYNLSFCDNYYFTKAGRDFVLQTFTECGIEILTKDTRECVDHIAVTGNRFKEAFSVTEWNMDKALSDHKGIAVELMEKQL